jgi:hypothetical protein
MLVYKSGATHFGVIAKSKQKTDKADAAALARFLKLGWLPEVPVPSEQVRTLRQLLRARETLVSMRTKLKNMAHAAFSRNGMAITRAAFASAVGRARLLGRDDLPAADLLVLRTCLRQIEQLNSEMRQIEEEITQRGKSAARRAAIAASAWAEPALGDQSPGGDRRHRIVRHVEAVSLLRGVSDLDEAIERDDAARRHYQAGTEAVAHSLHRGGAGDGQSN